MMSQDQSKKSAALAALALVKSGMRLGLGTGSTVEYFIEALGKKKFSGVCVPSSKASEELAKKAGLEVKTLNEFHDLHLYVDGADEVDKKFNLIKGGGGALTREKIVASASMEFICIVDETKIVQKLGKFPLPVEVLPFAEIYVVNELAELGGLPKRRDDFVTDNGNIILDVPGLDIKDPLTLETELNNIPGIVENGLFAVRQPDKVIVGDGKKTRELINEY